MFLDIFGGQNAAVRVDGKHFAVPAKCYYQYLGHSVHHCPHQKLVLADMLTSCKNHGLSLMLRSPASGSCDLSHSWTPWVNFTPNTSFGQGIEENFWNQVTVQNQHASRLTHPIVLASNVPSAIKAPILLIHSFIITTWFSSTKTLAHQKQTLGGGGCHSSQGMVPWDWLPSKQNQMGCCCCHNGYLPHSFKKLLLVTQKSSKMMRSLCPSSVYWFVSIRSL